MLDAPAPPDLLVLRRAVALILAWPDATPVEREQAAPDGETPPQTAGELSADGQAETSPVFQVGP
jgi:hypothetical protein